MDFYTFYSCFLKALDLIKKKLWIFFSMLLGLIILFLFFYIKHCFEMESSAAFIDFVNQDSEVFLNNSQIGIYEKVRKSIIDKKISCQKFIHELCNINPLFNKYIKFSSQINGVFEDSEGFFSKDFDSILESYDNPWSNLFISSKIFYDKYVSKEKGYPFFLNLYIQCAKGIKK